MNRSCACCGKTILEIGSSAKKRFLYIGTGHTANVDDFKDFFNGLIGALNIMKIFADDVENIGNARGCCETINFALLAKVKNFCGCFDKRFSGQ